MPSPVRYTEIKRLLESKGYAQTREKGSHFIFTKAGCAPITIPVHHGKAKYVYYRLAEKAQ